MKSEGRHQVSTHHQVYRSQGFYEVVLRGIGFKVKRITVNQDHRLSLRTHEHRDEHWVVIEGSTDVTKSGTRMILEAGQ